MLRRPAVLTAVAALLALPVLAGADAAVGSTAGAEVSASATRQAPVKGSTVDPSHPYSDPVHYPVRQPMRMDCYRKNPGCTTHSKYQLALVAPQADHPHNRVYPMGAGEVTRIDIGEKCGHGGDTTSFGTEIEISHGGGVTSRYGHLKKIGPGLKVGSLVSLDTVIGVMGNTGARTCASSPYLDFYVKKGKKQYHFKNLRTCVNGTEEMWPRDEYASYEEWNDVPRYAKKKIEFPRDSTDTLSGSCWPAGSPGSPDKAAVPSVRNAGRGKVKVSWSGATADSDTMIEVEVHRPSRHSWLLETSRQVGPGKTGYTVAKLPTGYDVRVRVSFHNSTGYGRASGWRTIHTTAK